MSKAREWFLVPSEDLTDKANWQLLGNNRFSACRARLLMVYHDSADARYGPILKSINLDRRHTRTLTKKKETLTSQTTTITETVQKEVTKRMLGEVASKVSSILGTKAPGFSGKVASEVSQKTQFEVTEKIGKTLSSTSSFLIQEVEGEEDAITFKESDTACTASIRRKFWPRRWDIYLHSVEYLELKYKKKWFWPDVRDTMKRNEWQIVGLPIASVHFYEPQLDVDITYDPVPDPLNTWNDIEVNRLEEKMPDYIPRHNPPTLEDLAKIAFPANKEEKKEKKAHLKEKKRMKMMVSHSVQKSRRRIAFKKASAMKAVARKAPARKGSVKRSPARRAPRMKK